MSPSLTLRAPSEVARLETERPVLDVAAAAAHEVDALSADPRHGGLAALLVGTLLLVDVATPTSLAALVTRVTRNGCCVRKGIGATDAKVVLSEGMKGRGGARRLCDVDTVSVRLHAPKARPCRCAPPLWTRAGRVDGLPHNPPSTHTWFRRGSRASRGHKATALRPLECSLLRAWRRPVGRRPQIS